MITEEINRSNFSAYVDTLKTKPFGSPVLPLLDSKLQSYQPQPFTDQISLELDLKDSLGIYDVERIKTKWKTLPDYVRAAREKLSGNDPMYDKIVLDKWGRKDVGTTLYTETPEMVFYRAAMKVAEGLVKNNSNLDYEKTVRYVFDKFVNRELFPNTPYMANGGHTLIAEYLESRFKERTAVLKQDLESILTDLNEEKKQKEQLFACFVLGIGDSRKSINKTLDEASEIQALIGGTGFNFDLRPANEVIAGSGGNTDGPISFMGGYSKYLGQIMNQGGKREGANMFMLNHDHPDIMRFIYSKREDGEISAANISQATWHEFMQAYLSETEEGSYYPLANPHYNQEKRPHIPKYYSEKQLRRALNIKKINKKARLSLLIDKNGIDVLSPFGIEIAQKVEGNKVKEVPQLIELGLDLNYKPEDRDKFIIGKIVNGTVYLNAKKVMRHLATGAWYNGEPGMIFTGTIDDYNPTHPRFFIDVLKEVAKNPDAFDRDKYKEVFDILDKYKGIELEQVIEMIMQKDDEFGTYPNLPAGVGIMIATNPCGEKPLLSYEACVLGHLNLETILDEVGSSEYHINYDKLAENTILMYQILDNAIDQNYFTLKEIEKTQKSNRKIGLGFMGLANALYKLEIPYGSEEALEFVKQVWGHVAKLTDNASMEKAELFGEFPNFKYSAYKDGIPLRNAIRRTLAPTGTTSFAAKTSGGCEPEYALFYTRTTVQGSEINLHNGILEEKLKKYNFFYDERDREALWGYIINVGHGSLQGFEIRKHEGETETSFNKRLENLNKIKKIFVTTYDITPENHLRMQAEVQKFTDDAISKTTNFRGNATIDDIEKAYVLAYKLGIKGTTFYRDGTRIGQPLEVKSDKLSLEERVNGQIDDEQLEEVLRKKISSPRPEDVGGKTKKLKTSHGSIFVTLNKREDTKKPYELFIEHGKEGEIPTSYTSALGRVISVALQAGVPSDLIAEKLIGITDEIIWDNGRKIRSGPDGVGQLILEIFGNNPNQIFKVEDDKNNNYRVCYFTENCKGRLIPSEGNCLKCTGCGKTTC